MAELDDNTRTGLHALGLGLLVIGIPVLIVQFVDMYQTVSVTTDHHTLQIFRNGYLLPQSGPQFSVATTTRMERIGMAALAALLAGGVLAVISFPFRRWLSPWAVGRWSASVIFLFFMWSALARPPRSVLVEKDSLTIVDHPTLFGDLTLPFSTMERVSVTSEWTWEQEEQKDGRTKLFVRNAERRIEVGSTSADDRKTDAALSFLRRNPTAE
ncbi:MAG: hypothetical protein IT229_05860 [Flavobacteriales bacterium]|nr:hypothetical protein [Flavobacteriales bacterium]